MVCIVTFVQVWKKSMRLTSTLWFFLHGLALKGGTGKFPVGMQCVCMWGKFVQ